MKQKDYVWLCENEAGYRAGGYFHTLRGAQRYCHILARDFGTDHNWKPRKYVKVK